MLIHGVFPVTTHRWIHFAIEMILKVMRVSTQAHVVAEKKQSSDNYNKRNCIQATQHDGNSVAGCKCVRVVCVCVCV